MPFSQPADWMKSEGCSLPVVPLRYSNAPLSPFSVIPVVLSKVNPAIGISIIGPVTFASSDMTVIVTPAPSPATIRDAEMPTS